MAAAVGSATGPSSVSDTFSAQRVVRTGGVHGRVTNEQGAPVPGVQLQLSLRDGSAADSHAAVSDSSGAFAWSGLSAGSYQLTAKRIGFEAVDVGVRIQDGVDRLVDIRMTKAAQRLDTVSVAGKSLTPGRYGTSSRMDEFYRRKQQGRGHFFTREDIDDSDANNTATLLARVPGIHSKREDTGVIYVRFSSCVGATGQLTPSAGNDWGWEKVALFVDGVGIGKGSRSSVFSTLQPVEIEAMEVYRGAEVPLEALGDACAAVYVWTRGG
jgi:hypothetical protein